MIGLASTLLAPTILGLTLAASPPAPPISNAEVLDRTSVTDPARVGDVADGQWIAFSIPALADTRAPCCWNGRWNQAREVGCTLGGHRGFHGTWDRSPRTDRLTVYAQFRRGEVREVEVLGDVCPVDGDQQTIHWLGSVEDDDALDWLERVALADPDDDPAHGAVHAIARHANSQATERLDRLARHREEDLAGNAIFWLGEARGEAGYDRLESLLQDLPRGDIRQRINFALTQNESDQASDLLLAISTKDRDPEQQADALFWLAESGHPQALDRLVSALDDRDEDLRHRALHGLSELEQDEAAEALAHAARHHRDEDTRGQAMFWLAESYPERARPLLLDVIQSERDEDVLHQAVFALSQLPGGSTEVLLELARGDYQREVRRQAIFWLAQSDDEEAIDALEALLTQ